MENCFKTADQYLDARPQNIDLYNNIWSANTTCLLHGPRSVDKSSLAIDIAINLTARANPVFYLTTSRMSDALCAKIKGVKNLYVHQSAFSAPDDPTDFADIVIKDIEDAIQATDAKVFIIDSLSRIAALSFGRNASPSYIMKRLVALQMRHGVSILVISHDTTPASTRSLISFADSEIALSETKEEAPEAARPVPPTPPAQPKPAERTPNYNHKPLAEFHHYSRAFEAPDPTPFSPKLSRPYPIVASKLC